MTQRDKKQFAILMASMAEVFDRGSEISTLKIDLYFKALEKYPIDHISKAISSLICGRVFPSLPKPAEIIQEIDGKREDLGTVAWLQVLESVKRIGNYKSVKFSDPIIHSVIQAMGGWTQLCTMECSEEKWKQKEFERLYSVISERSGRHPDYLPGDIEIRNKNLGYDIGVDVVRIGFEKENKRIER